MKQVFCILYLRFPTGKEGVMRSLGSDKDRSQVGFETSQTRALREGGQVAWWRE